MERPTRISHSIIIPTKIPAMKKIDTEGLRLDLHERLGISPEYTRGEIRKLMNQDENLAVKQKALAPLARELGYDVDPVVGTSLQNIIIMMPAEIASKHQLITPSEIIDV